MADGLRKTCAALLVAAVVTSWRQVTADGAGVQMGRNGFRLYDGVYVNVPENPGISNSSEGRSLLTIHVDPQSARKSPGRDDDNNGLQRILPLFILPFLIQSAIVPVFLSALKFMLLKSLIVGKVALALIAANAFRNSNVFKSRNEERLADVHYGYHGVGNEEYGSYFNGWSSNNS